MTDDRAELYRLILGRTATAAVEAVLAAGFERRKQYKREEWERCAKGPHSQAAHILDCDPRGASWHECEEWQTRDSASAGRRYCAACGRAEKPQSFGRTEEREIEVVVDSSKVFMVMCQDPEAHAKSYNEGYEAAVTQGLADDPSLADDWLDGKLAEAFAYGWREGKGAPTPVNSDTGELLHGEALQPDFNPYRGEGDL